jgi:hypothetical protein
MMNSEIPMPPGMDQNTIQAPTVQVPTAQRPTAPPANTTQTVNASLLRISSIILVATLSITLLFSFVSSFLSGAIGYRFIYFLILFIGSLTVTAFIIMGVAAFSLSSKLKKANTKGTWSLLIGIAALLCALAWAGPAVFNGSFSFYVGLKYEISYSTLNAIVVVIALLSLFLKLAAATLFILAAVSAKKSLQRSFGPGVIGPILLMVSVVASDLFNIVIFPMALFPALSGSMSITTIGMISVVINAFFTLLVIAFAVCQMLFYAAAAKQLAKGVYMQAQPPAYATATPGVVPVAAPGAAVGYPPGTYSYQQYSGQAVANGDASSFGFAVLGFFFPLVGLILFLVWKDQYPLRSKSAGKGALIGVISEVVLSIIAFVILIALSAALY